MASKQNIRGLELNELKDFFTQNGDQAFRAKQVFEWLWKKQATTFDEMTSLSVATRELLKTNFEINVVTIA